jgi:hypothetical protein
MTVGDLISHPEMGNGIIIEHQPHHIDAKYDMVKILWVKTNQKTDLLWLYHNDFLRGWKK